MLMGIIPQAALAQDTNPGLPDGSNFLFLSTIIQKQDRPFAVPVPVIINGGVQAASGESAFCGEILKGTEVAASSSEGQCLAGPRIGLASSGYAVTNVGWQNFAPQGFGGNTTNVQPIAENESALVLGGIRFDVEPLDFGNTDVQMFRLRLSPQQSGVQPASTTQEVEGGAELFLRLTRMSREVSALHPLPVPEDTPVFPRISPNPSTLRFIGTKTPSSYLPGPTATTFPLCAPLSSSTPSGIIIPDLVSFLAFSISFIKTLSAKGFKLNLFSSFFIFFSMLLKIKLVKARFCNKSTKTGN
jgi:hypothetical protein